MIIIPSRISLSSRALKLFVFKVSTPIQCRRASPRSPCQRRSFLFLFSSFHPYFDLLTPSLASIVHISLSPRGHVLIGLITSLLFLHRLSLICLATHCEILHPGPFISLHRRAVGQLCTRFPHSPPQLFLLVESLSVTILYWNRVYKYHRLASSRQAIVLHLSLSFRLHAPTRPIDNKLSYPFVVYPSSLQLRSPFAISSPSSRISHFKLPLTLVLVFFRSFSTFRDCDTHASMGSQIPILQLVR